VVAVAMHSVDVGHGEQETGQRIKQVIVQQQRT
jgi:hypothetical protein